MRILVITIISLVQSFGKRRCISFVNAQDESLKDSNQRRALIGKGRNLPDGKTKESFKDIFDELQSKSKGKGVKSVDGAKAPKGTKGSLSDLSATTCRLCGNGVSVGNPNAFVVANSYYLDELNNVTCSKLDSFLTSYVQPDEGFCYDA